MCVTGAGADLLGQTASPLQLPGLSAKPARAGRQRHGQEGEALFNSIFIVPTGKYISTEDAAYPLTRYSRLTKTNPTA